VIIYILGAHAVATRLGVTSHITPFHFVIAELITSISDITIIAPIPAMVVVSKKAISPLHSTLKYWNQ
jgi:hypothetical protein